MLTIKWIGQSGYILSDGKTEICIDPYLSDAVNRVAGRARMVPAPFFPDELTSDAVICTHNHLDHVDIDAIPVMKKGTMLFLAPQDAKSQLLECGVLHYQAFDEGTTAKIGDFKLQAVFANHSVPAIGVIIRHSGITMYFSGDTEYHERLEALASENIDIMCICINGKLGNMNVSEAVRLTEVIKPKVGIPTHYGMFASNTENPESYTEQIPCGFIMEYNKEYDVEEVLGHV
ncbi:MAG: MBL fold metallo-hydrolase [Clostridia bacterium]|nr:MBL fold metallo-hydrolase [Clostridia bacterium]